MSRSRVGAGYVRLVWVSCERVFMVAEPMGRTGTRTREVLGASGTAWPGCRRRSAWAGPQAARDGVGEALRKATEQGDSETDPIQATSYRTAPKKLRFLRDTYNWLSWLYRFCAQGVHKKGWRSRGVGHRTTPLFSTRISALAQHLYAQVAN